MVLCTKLVQWLCGGAVVLVIWWSLLSGILPFQVSPHLHDAILPLPLYLVVSYGCYSLTVIGYRLMTFNDCNQAAADLRKEIAEAKKDLRSKGLKI